MTTSLRCDDFEIAVVCTLPLERDALEAVMEELPPFDAENCQPQKADGNAYTLGLLAGIPVVLALRPPSGNESPAAVWSDLRTSFSNIRLAIVVGLCGARPEAPDGSEVLLGDVICDLGRCYNDNIQQRRNTKEIGPDPRNSFKLSTFTERTSRKDVRRRICTGTNATSAEMLRNPMNGKEFKHPGIKKDFLFSPSYIHKHREPYPCATCSKRTKRDDPDCLAAKVTDCTELGCDLQMYIPRQRDVNYDPISAASFGFPELAIHFGQITGSTTSSNSAWHRDQIAIDTASPGPCDWIPTILVGGVCDYADGHKSECWKGFAALSAAACAEALLKEWVVSLREADSSPSYLQDGRSIMTETPPIYRDCLQILFVTDPEKDLAKARACCRNGRTEGTCEWILNQPEYTQWHIDAAPQLLIIIGEPGIGKTVMATFLVERLMKEVEQERGLLVSVFVSHVEPKRRTATSILKGILHQILSRRPELLEYARQALTAYGPEIFEDLETLWLIFVRVIRDRRLGHLTLVIDSLDNCEMPMRRTLVRRLEELLRSTSASENYSWRFLILTRPQAWDLANCRKLHWMRVITMSAASVNTDLRRFMQKETDAVAQAKRWSPSTREAVQTQLERKNGGTFLWVSLALRDISNLKEKLVVERLQRFSGTLYDLYSRVLSRIDAEDAECAEYTLHFIIGASRPLSVTELALALYFRYSQDRQGISLPSDKDIEELKGAVRSCGYLLRVRGQGDRATVELVHQSVKDFLTSDELPFGLRRYRTSEAKAAERLAKACAAYLSTNEIRKVSFDLKGLLRSAKVRSQLLTNNNSRVSFTERRVSASDIVTSPENSASWSNAWSDAGQVSVSNKQMALMQFATSAWATMSAWKQLRALPRPVLDLLKLSSKSEALLFAAVKVAISEGQDLIFRYLITLLLGRLNLDEGLQLFSAAIQYNKSGVLPALKMEGRMFWSGELPDAEVIYGELKGRWSALLHEATNAGLIDVVKFCIQHGDDIAGRDVDENTPLHLAARAGYCEIVTMLIKADSRKRIVRLANRTGETPLHLAAGEGEFDVVKALIKADSSRSTLCIRDRDGEVALHRAVLSTKPEVVKLLVDADVDKSSLVIEDRDGRLPLHNAAMAGDLEAVRMLVDAEPRGFTLIARDGDGETALDHAFRLAERLGSEATHTAVAEYLRGQSMVMFSGEMVKADEVVVVKQRMVA